MPKCLRPAPPPAPWPWERDGPPLRAPPPWRAPVESDRPGPYDAYCDVALSEYNRRPDRRRQRRRERVAARRELLPSPRAVAALELRKAVQDGHTVHTSAPLRRPRPTPREVRAKECAPLPPLLCPRPPPPPPPPRVTGPPRCFSASVLAATPPAPPPPLPPGSSGGSRPAAAHSPSARLLQISTPHAGRLAEALQARLGALPAESIHQPAKAQLKLSARRGELSEQLDGVQKRIVEEEEKKRAAREQSPDGKGAKEKEKEKEKEALKAKWDGDDGLLKRLTREPKQKTEKPPPDPRVLGPDDVEALVQKLAVADIQNREKRLRDKLKKQTAPPDSQRRLTPDSLAAHVDHMYTEAQKARAQQLRDAEARMWAPRAPAPRPPQVRENVARLAQPKQRELPHDVAVARLLK